MLRSTPNVFTFYLFALHTANAHAHQIPRLSFSFSFSFSFWFSVLLPFLSIALRDPRFSFPFPYLYVHPQPQAVRLAPHLVSSPTRQVRFFSYCACIFHIDALASSFASSCI